MTNFTTWLTEYLKSVEVDDDAFVDYIVTLLEDDSVSEEETFESIQAFLEGAVVSN